MINTLMDKDNHNEYDDNEPNVSYAGNTEVYYSDIVGSSIRDAITGARTPWMVGSINERRYFKVRSSTAYSNPYAKGVSSGSRRETRQAFYDTPDSYMKHQDVVLDPELVKMWYNKVNKLFPGKYNYDMLIDSENS